MIWQVLSASLWILQQCISDIQHNSKFDTEEAQICQICSGWIITLSQNLQIRKYLLNHTLKNVLHTIKNTIQINHDFDTSCDTEAVEIL